MIVFLILALFSVLIFVFAIGVLLGCALSMLARANYLKGGD